MYFTIKNEYGAISYFDNDEEMLKQRDANLFFEQNYVVSYLKDYILQSKVILDIGAHCGSHTILYKKLNPEVQVYSFEPQSKMYNLLVKNIEDNGLDKVYPYNNAVGDYTGRVEMNGYSTDGANSMKKLAYGGEDLFNLGGVQIGSGGESVQMVKIDELKMPCCDFVKIDVEGYEPHVIEGAKLTIQICRPVISYEVNHKSSDRATRTATELLESYNYTCRNVWSENWIATPNF